MADNTPPVAPYLTVEGGLAALDFYKKAFAAVVAEPMMAEDGKRVMHASFTIQGGTIMLSDHFAEHEGGPLPKTEKPGPIAVILNYATPAEVDATHERAVKAGAKPEMAPADMFWGARFSTLVDPFGHRWLLHAALPK